MRGLLGVLAGCEPLGAGGRVIARFICGLDTLDRDDHVLFIGRILAQRLQRLILG